MSSLRLGAGIRGDDVAGGPVFVKRVALTDLEGRDPHATANLFGLPTWAHYGVGAGAWRELASHVMASDWALTDRCENFLVLHHWRVLAR
jgi:hypothetical protein